MNRVKREVLMILWIELVSVLFVLCFWGFKVVFDPFEHIHECMQVEEVWCEVGEEFGAFGERQGKFLPC